MLTQIIIKLKKLLLSGYEKLYHIIIFLSLVSKLVIRVVLWEKVPLAIGLS